MHLKTTLLFLLLSGSLLLAQSEDDPDFCPCQLEKEIAQSGTSVSLVDLIPRGLPPQQQVIFQPSPPPPAFVPETPEEASENEEAVRRPSRLEPAKRKRGHRIRLPRQRKARKYRGGCPGFG